MVGQIPPRGQALILSFVVLAITVRIAYLKMKIAAIHFYQDFFWIGLFIMVVSVIVFVISLILGLIEGDELKFIISFACLISALVFYMLTSYAYSRGYSVEALENLSKYENEVQQLEQIRSVLTGDIIWDVQDQIIEQMVAQACAASNSACEPMKESYKLYREIKGAKDTADEFASYLKIINKIEKSQGTLSK